MNAYALNHLSDEALLRELSQLVIRDRKATAELLAHIAEVDARKLYAEAGYSSMFTYCVEKLHLSEDAAYKRIRAARVARQFPVLFQEVAEGRLHLAAVSMLAPHLTGENVEDLISAAIHKGKSEIEVLIAHRFGASGVPARSFSITAIPARTQLAPGRVEPELFSKKEGENDEVPARVSEGTRTRDVRRDPELAPGRVEARSEPASPEPEEYSLRVRISKTTHDKLRRLQASLSHALPSGDVAQVLDRAFDALIEKVEKRKLGAKVSRPVTRQSTPTAAMFRCGCVAPCGSETRVSAPSSAWEDSVAVSGHSSSWIIECRLRVEGSLRWKTCGYGVTLTINSKRSVSSAATSWRPNELPRRLLRTQCDLEWHPDRRPPPHRSPGAALRQGAAGQTRRYISPRAFSRAPWPHARRPLRCSWGTG